MGIGAKYFMILILITMLSGCEEHRKDALEDKTKAMEIANLFYAKVMKRQFYEISTQFKGRMSSNEALVLLAKNDTLFGAFQKYEILSLITDITKKNGVETGSYIITSTGTYMKGQTREQLVIMIEEKGYRIDSYVA